MSDTLNRLKTAVRAAVAILPGGTKLLRARERYLERRRVVKAGHAERVFTSHFADKVWGDGESVSGPGSSAAATELVRRALPGLLADLDVRSILDAPCGDFYWFQLIPWETPISYTGGDVVQALVDRNQTAHGNESRRFVKLDIMHDQLPAADLWLCRDCLFHLSNRGIELAIENFLRSGVKYLLTTVHIDCTENVDIPTGSFRPLNLRLPPFNFPEPERVIADSADGAGPRHLALWSCESLAGLRRT